MLFSIGSFINLHEEDYSYYYFRNNVLRMKVYGKFIAIFLEKGKFEMKEKGSYLKRKCNFIHK